jgi:hypothetical protein
MVTMTWLYIEKSGDGQHKLWARFLTGIKKAFSVNKSQPTPPLLSQKSASAKIFDCFPH